MANTKKKEKKIELKDIFELGGHGVDIPFLLITLALLVFGLIMLYSAGYVKGIYAFNDEYHYIKKQCISAALGLLLMAVASTISRKFIKHFSIGIWLASLALLCLVFLYEPYNGCQRWITIKGLGTFQPSEIAKLAIIVNFAAVLEKNTGKLDKIKYGLLPFAIFLRPVVLLLILEPHLSCIVIIFCISAIMMFVGEVDWKIFALVIGTITLTVGVVIVISMNVEGSYFYSRIHNFINKDTVDLTVEGYQSYMSLLAIGSGGWTGLGFGNSRQKHLHLPERWNDFIYSIAVEELGFIGSLIIVGLFVAFFFRGMYIARHAADKFGSLLVVGIVCQVAIQAGLNIGVATNTIPNTGISLPFFSEGGTALILLLAEVGVVLSISRTCNFNEGKSDESNNSGRRDSRTYKSGAGNSTEN